MSVIFDEKKAEKEKLHFGLFLGLFFCSIITMKASHSLEVLFCCLKLNNPWRSYIRDLISEEISGL